MSKDDKAGPVKNEAELELEELAAEDDGSQLNDEDEEKESEEEETEEEEGSDAKGETRERDPKTGRFKPVKQDKKTKDDALRPGFQISLCDDMKQHRVFIIRKYRL